MSRVSWISWRIIPALFFGLLAMPAVGQETTPAVEMTESTPTASQEGAGDELKLIRQLLENQSKQIEALTQEVSRLRAEVEAQIPKAVAARVSTAPSALPGSDVPPSPEPSGGGAGTTAESMPPGAEMTPAVPTGPTYTVKAGETLTSIAKQFNTTIAKLMELNKITDGRKLQIGQTLLMPTPEPQPLQETP